MDDYEPFIQSSTIIPSSITLDNERMHMQTASEGANDKSESVGAHLLLQHLFIVPQPLVLHVDRLPEPDGMCTCDATDRGFKTVHASCVLVAAQSISTITLCNFLLGCMKSSSSSSSVLNRHHSPQEHEGGHHKLFTSYHQFARIRTDDGPAERRSMNHACT